jgi:hypothetical protein
MKSIWNVYSVHFTFLGDLCASTPADPELMKKWLEARKPAAFPPGGRSIAEIQEEVFSTIAVEELEDAQTQKENLLVFQRVDGNLVERTATFRAHIKDCARVLSAQYIGKMKGQRSFATRIVNGVYHDERQYWTTIRKADGEPFTAVDGQKEKAIRFRLPTGQQMSAIKVFEFVRQANVEFNLKVLGNSVSREDLETVFTYGGVHGYAGERGDGEGRYTFSIEEKEHAE